MEALRYIPEHSRIEPGCSVLSVHKELVWPQATASATLTTAQCAEDWDKGRRGRHGSMEEEYKVATDKIPRMGGCSRILRES